MGLFSIYPMGRRAVSKEPLFGGAFYNKQDDLIYITRVIYNQPYTIVLWSDGTKTIAKCREGDTYNKELGLAIAVMKKICGKNFTKNLYEDWLPKANETAVNLSDVRKAHNKK